MRYEVYGDEDKEWRERFLAKVFLICEHLTSVHHIERYIFWVKFRRNSPSLSWRTSPW